MSRRRDDETNVESGRPRRRARARSGWCRRRLAHLAGRNGREGGADSADHLGRLERTRAERVQERRRRVRQEESQRHRQRRRLDQRQQDRRGDPGRHRARRRQLVQLLQRRHLLRDRRLDQPRAADGAEPHQREHLPGRDAVLHAVQRRALRTAAARRHVRPLLQQGPLCEGGDQEPAEDDVGARGRREEADRAELERHDQGRRDRPDDRLLRERARALDHLVRRQVAGRAGPLDPLEGPRLVEVADLAQRPRRLVRVQQPREVPGRAR